MAFFNGQKNSKLFVVTLLIVSMIASYSMPLSIYAVDGDAEVRDPTTTEEASTIDSSLEPTDDTVVPEPDLTSYVVEYETADGTKVSPDKVVVDKPIGAEVTEDALEVSGCSVDESSKSITLDADENIITFIYTQVEEEVIPPEEEVIPPAEELLPPVVEIPEIVEEAATEPAIVAEPTTTSLTITHRLIVGDQYADDVRTVEGLEIGQVINLEPYILTEDWFELASDVSSITLNEEKTSIIMEYKPVEGFVVVIPEEIPNDMPDM